MPYTDSSTQTDPLSMTCPSCSATLSISDKQVERSIPVVALTSFLNIGHTGRGTMKGLTANEVTFDPSNRPDNHSLELAREYEQSLQRDMERSLVNVSQVYPKHLDPSNPEHFIELTKEGEKSWAETCKSYIETYGSGSDSRFRNTYKSVFDCKYFDVEQYNGLHPVCEISGKERSQFSDSGRIGWMRYEREVERMKESRSEEQRP